MAAEMDLLTERDMDRVWSVMSAKWLTLSEEERESLGPEGVFALAALEYVVIKDALRDGIEVATGAGERLTLRRASNGKGYELITEVAEKKAVG